MQARAPPHPVLPRKRLSAHNNVLLQTLRERYPLTASLTGTQHFHVLGSGQHALPPAPCDYHIPVSMLCSTLPTDLAGQDSSTP